MDMFQNCYKLLKFSHGCENAKFQILMFEQVNIDNFGHEYYGDGGMGAGVNFEKKRLIAQILSKNYHSLSNT